MRTIRTRNRDDKNEMWFMNTFGCSAEYVYFAKPYSQPPPPLVAIFSREFSKLEFFSRINYTRSDFDHVQYLNTLNIYIYKYKTVEQLAVDIGFC